MKIFFRSLILAVPLVLYAVIIYFRPVLSCDEYQTAVVMREWFPGVFYSHIAVRIPSLLLVVFVGLLIWLFAVRWGIKFPIQAVAVYSLLFPVIAVGSMAPTGMLLIILPAMAILGIFVERLWEKLLECGYFSCFRKFVSFIAVLWLTLSLCACVIALLAYWGVIKPLGWFHISFIPATLLPLFWFIMAKSEPDDELKFLEIEVGVAFLMLLGCVAVLPFLRADVAPPELPIRKVVSQLDKKRLLIVADDDNCALMRWITNSTVGKFTLDINTPDCKDLLVVKNLDGEEVLPGVPKIVWKFGSRQLLLFPMSGEKK